MANTVSENIRKLRQKKGISQDRLSKEADIALNTVVKIETGESPNPTVDTLEKIAKALDVEIKDLFAFKHQRNKKFLMFLFIKIYG